ncbi:transmembrane protein, putative (macronuclear) [Tetrahymena thermophila SB210]|uniref:Transmembrane protein, putative n=1 Tax=Tetrahymena thermophila (strain SB210) TaxID=312017 RepID=W7XDA0_TETTS|nr:transmembrane protein, putative [Tetrahymena thermophila SB210]EWS71786.1 transmembrane protein, putative [Tetrahymena thermophila SB210]|eukprot:XP_012655673.1 transmembrane protein, putative [Tetrahymena thermophila SB210]
MKASLSLNKNHFKLIIQKLKKIQTKTHHNPSQTDQTQTIAVDKRSFKTTITEVLISHNQLTLLCKIGKAIPLIEALSKINSTGIICINKEISKQCKIKKQVSPIFKIEVDLKQTQTQLTSNRVSRMFQIILLILTWIVHNSYNNRDCNNFNINNPKFRCKINIYFSKMSMKKKQKKPQQILEHLRFPKILIIQFLMEQIKLKFKQHKSPIQLDTKRNNLRIWKYTFSTIIINKPNQVTMTMLVNQLESLKECQLAIFFEVSILIHKIIMFRVSVFKFKKNIIFQIAQFKIKFLKSTNQKKQNIIILNLILLKNNFVCIIFFINKQKREHFNEQNNYNQYNLNLFYIF